MYNNLKQITLKETKLKAHDYLPSYMQDTTHSHLFWFYASKTYISEKGKDSTRAREKKKKVKANKTLYKFTDKEKLGDNGYIKTNEKQSVL